MSPKTRKKLPNLAWSRVHLNYNRLCSAEEDGLAVGASLAGILANLRSKGYQPALKMVFPKMTLLNEDINISNGSALDVT